MAVVSGLEWQDGLSGGNVRRASVGWLGSLTVVWDACGPRDVPEAGRLPPYTVTVFGHRMRPRFSDRGEAEEFAERMARVLVAEAAGQLGLVVAEKEGDGT